MLDLKYNIIIEATKDPQYFGYFSPDLPGFTGGGISIPSILEELNLAIEEHLEVMRENGHIPPKPTFNPQIVIKNETEEIEEVA